MSDDFITQLKSEYNLAEIIGATHQLRDVGRGDFVGRCPFHGEDTASFRVNNERFHCFGCHIHGDIFSWLMKMHGATFPQAIRMLTKKDIPLPDRSKKLKKQKIVSDYDAQATYRIMQINEIAQSFYKNVTIDKEARDYIDSRISKEAQEKFGIGYAPLHQEKLLDKLIKKKFSYADMLAASLVATDSVGNYYPRLRDRIVFPLFSPSGYILGFAGRAIERQGAAKPNLKYVNPPDTAAFSKKRYLYGSHEPVKGFLGVVEGYLDVVSLWDRGVINACSIMGTHASPEQIEVLKYRTSKAWVMMDGDKPGLSAAAKLAPQLLESEIEGFTIYLTDKEDPDTVCKLFPDTREYLSTLPRVKFIEYLTSTLLVHQMQKEKWDRGILDELAKPYVDDNIKKGYSHYNIISWVCAAYPDHRPAIQKALKQMIEDPEIASSGVKRIRDEHAKAFLKAWMRPCKEVRISNNER